jgi:hypothetical protein
MIYNSSLEKRISRHQSKGDVNFYGGHLVTHRWGVWSPLEQAGAGGRAWEFCFNNIIHPTSFDSTARRYTTF